MDNKKVVICNYIILLVISVLVICKIYFGNIDFEVMPFNTGEAQDASFCLALIKGIQENGFLGMVYNNRIGTPNGSSMIDFPCGDTWMFLGIYVLSIFVKNTVEIYYFYYILSFIAIALAMSYLLFRLEFNWKINFIFSLLYTLAPYHFVRFEQGHLNLWNYFEIPLGLYLALVIIGYIKSDNQKKEKIICFVCAAIIGLGQGYYYFYSLLVMGFAYLYRLIIDKNKKEALKEVWMILVVIGFVFVGLSPYILYQINNGVNTAITARSFIEQEINALKLITLILPVSYSRIDFMKTISNTYFEQAKSIGYFVKGNEAAALGTVGTVGLGILAVIFFKTFTQQKQEEKKEKELLNIL